VDSRLQAAKKDKKGDSLNAAEVQWFSKLCQEMRPAPRTPSNIIKTFNLLISRLHEAIEKNEGVTMTAQEVEAYVSSQHRSALYLPYGRKPEQVFMRWLTSYQDLNFDNSHSLDFRRDPSKDYSVGLVIDKEGLEAKLEGASREDIEVYAETYYFCLVACIERLKEARVAKSGATYNSVESQALLHCRDRYMRQTPGYEEQMRNVPQHPEMKAFMKLCDATFATKPATLTAGEVVALLKVCDDVPVPKPKPNTVQAKGSTKTSSAKEILGNVKDEDKPSSPDGDGFRDILDKLIKGKPGESGLVLNHAESLTLHFFHEAYFPEEKVRNSYDPSHPMVTSFNKLEDTLFHVTKDTTLDSNEVRYFLKLFQGHQSSLPTTSSKNSQAMNSSLSTKFGRTATNNISFPNSEDVLKNSEVSS
jgi:hypothetical protein